MSTKPKSILRGLDGEQVAEMLLIATFDYLAQHGVPKKVIARVAMKYVSSNRELRPDNCYHDLIAAWSAMGKVLNTWHSDPRFIDEYGMPVPVTSHEGRHSITKLIRASGVRITKSQAIELFRASPSVKELRDERFVALRRVFVLPSFELLRAAYVVERYLAALRANSKRRRDNAPLLLERNCHVSPADLRKAAPVLRDIKEHATAFMDSVDGALESCRINSSSTHSAGEVGVLVFAWNKPINLRKAQR